MFTSTPLVLELMKPLKELGITYFTYSRMEKEGGRIYLSSDAPTLEHYLKTKGYKRGNTEAAPGIYKPQIVMWDTLPNQDVINENARARNFDHGMFMIRPQNEYCEFFAFATQKGNDRIINTYLSKLELLINFTHYFLEQGASLIKQVNASKLSLPFHEKKLDFIEENNEETKLALLQITPFTNQLLSKRQKECAKLLIEGKTTREIAASLLLSPCTIEHYLDNLRKKLNCKNKMQLLCRLTENRKFI